MKKQLFQYVVILHKYEDPKAEATASVPVYRDSEIIIQPKTMLAKSEKDVLFKVTREIPEQYADNPDNVEILIAPF